MMMKVDPILGRCGVQAQLKYFLINEVNKSTLTVEYICLHGKMKLIIV